MTKSLLEKYNLKFVIDDTLGKVPVNTVIEHKYNILAEVLFDWNDSQSIFELIQELKELIEGKLEMVDGDGELVEVNCYREYTFFYDTRHDIKIDEPHFRLQTKDYIHILTEYYNFKTSPIS